MSNEELWSHMKDLDSRMKEVEFLLKVIMNRLGFGPGQIEAYRKLEENGELKGPS